MKITPIVKWAGGKRQLLPVLKKMMPEHYNRYIEPFFGGGALFFDVLPENAIVNDLNTYLINLYEWIRNEPDTIMGIVSHLQDDYNKLPSLYSRQEYFLHIREQFNHCISTEDTCCECAAYFLFLNKSCYNGLYRVNSKGLFNSSFGKKKHLNLYDDDLIRNISSALSMTTILNTDYKTVCEYANAGDFIFFDPPYHNTFSNYQKDGFSDDEHIHLANLYRHLSNNGVYCMLTNSNTAFIQKLYESFYIKNVPVKRLINRNVAGRVGEEVIVTNYPTK